MKLFAGLAAFSERHARLLIPAWLLLAVVLSVTAPSLQDVGSQDLADFLPKDSTSLRADTLLRERFPDDPTRESAIVVLARAGGLSEADRTFISALSRFAVEETDGAFPGVQSTATAPDLAPLLRSADGEAELVVMTMGRAPFSQAATDSITGLRDYLDAEAPQGLRHHVTGVGGLAADQAEALVQSFDRTAIVSVLLVLLILVLVYRSAVAPLVPLATIAIAFLVARGVIGFMADAGLTVASMVETFMVVMIFGAGTDYCLFIVSRYREELHRGDPVPATLRRTMTVMGAVIAASAATVVVGFLSQLGAKFGMYRTFGPAIGIAIFITLVAGLTLTPALLRVAGRFSFWPNSLDRVRDRPPEHASPRWERLGAVVRDRPREVLLGGIILLLLPSAGLAWMHESYDLLSDLPGSADARVGFDVLERHYPGGRLSPVMVLVADDEPIVSDGRLAAVDALTDRLRGVEGVAEVRSITQPAGAPLTQKLADELAATGGFSTDPASFGIDPNQVDVSPLIGALSSPEGLRFTGPVLSTYPQILERLRGPFVGRDGASTRVIVALEGNPYERSALETFRRVDDVAADSLAGTELSGARLAVGGPTSFFSDMETLGRVDFRRITAFLVAGVFVVLALLLRSLVAPFYLLATVLLSYFGTLGLTVAVFQGIFGSAGIMFWLPPFLFVILVALGADYNIFITSRIREEVDAGSDVAHAAVQGLVLTGRVITSAGLILAGTFAALMVAPLPNLRQIGFAVTAGVLIDTFVVRPLLVPAATVLLGEWAFWPGTRPEHVRGSVATLVPRLVGAAMVLLAVVLGVAAFGARVEGAVERVPARAAEVAVAGEHTERPNDHDTATPTPDAGSVSASPGGGAQGQGGGAITPSSAPATITPPTTARPGTTTPPPGAPQRVAVPETGSWRYHSEGTRKIGLAGSPQSFSEDVMMEVSKRGGSADEPEMRLYASSSNGNDEQIRRYGGDAAFLLETHVSGFGQSFGGTLQPPARMIPWPVEVGQPWSDAWTTGAVQGSTTSRVTGTRSYSVGGTAYTCYVVDSHTQMSGDASGTQDQVSCWVIELGMIVEAEVTIDVTYNGVPVEVDEHRTLLATP